MRRRHPEDERQPEAKKPGPSAPAAGILALQQSAGNHAVASMLSREEKAPQREPATANLDGIGLIILESLSSPARKSAQPGGGGAGAARDRADGLVELVCTSRHGEHSATLMQANMGGKHIPEAAFENRGFTISLKGCVVESYQVTDDPGADRPFETWTISGEKK